MSSDATSFADLLRHLRTSAALSQEELANRAGLSLRGVSDLERAARRTPHLTTVRLLADALGLDNAERRELLAAARPGSVPEMQAGTLVGAAPLPTPLTSLVGRERELAKLVALLGNADTRLLTLTGAGGSGKTRLAIAVAERLAEDFADRAWFVGLAPVTNPTLVAPSIAQVLGVREAGREPLTERLQAHLSEKHLLLVLDNFEQVVEAAPLVTDLLGACSALKILVTSRVRLRVSGEHEYVAPPLGLAQPDAQTTIAGAHASEAVRLFVARAQAVREDFALTAENATTVARICQRLDGLPLAIELAAPRIKVLPPTALLARLEPRLPLLTGGGRDAPARQRTMRDAIAWSYDLLTAPEQTLFRRLAIFVGGFTLEAAEAICRVHGEPGLDVLEGVASLADKSLLRQQEDGPDGEPRYLMLETVREYGLERLAASDEIAETRQAHGAYFLVLVEQAAAALRGSQQVAWFARLETEQPNQRAALDWFWQRGDAEAGLRLGAALWEFWFIRGHNREGRAWLARALAVPHRWSPALREALHGASMLASNQGDDLQAAAYAEELLTTARGQGDQEGVARALFLLSFAATYRGDRARALGLADEALALFRHLGDPFWIAIALNRLGIECHIQGDYVRAVALYDEARGAWRELGCIWELSCVTTNLGVTAQAQGDHSRAAVCYQESLDLLQTLGETWGNDEVLALVAALAAASGRWEQAARLIGATAGLLESIGYALPPFVHTFYERATASVRRDLGEEGFAAGCEAGRRLTPTQAISEAFAVASVLADIPALIDPAAAADPSRHGLTLREMEVLRLVAQGRSNREVADALFISVPTVKRHLSTVLGKLELPSRSAATAYAHTHHLV